MAEYDPYADLANYNTDLRRRGVAAQATSAASDKAAATFGLQNLEGMQALAKQKLVNRGNLDQAYIGQGIDHTMDPVSRLAAMTLSKQADTTKDAMSAAHEAAGAGLSMDMGETLNNPLEWLIQGLTQGSPTAEKAARAGVETKAVDDESEEERLTTDADGNQIGVTKAVTRKAGTQTTNAQRNTPTAARNSEARLNPGERSEPATTQANTVAQQRLQQSIAGGGAAPDSKLTGRIENGRAEVVSPTRGKGWLPLQ